MGRLKKTNTLSLTASSPNSVHNVSRNTFISLSLSLFSSWQLSFLQFFPPSCEKLDPQTMSQTDIVRTMVGCGSTSVCGWEFRFHGRDLFYRSETPRRR